ncbi:predicted protein, partial [Arabidopsis lyrata subsp. lyrata]
MRTSSENIGLVASPKSDYEPLELSWTSGYPNTLFYTYLYFAVASRKIKISTAQSLNEFSTTIKDHAIESIKSTYKVNKVWTGNPCSPRLFPWEGTSNYQIKSMSLSTSWLQGPIAVSFRNLSLLESQGSHVALQTTSKVTGKGGFGKNSKNIRNRNQISLDIVLWLLKCKSLQ